MILRATVIGLFLSLAMLAAEQRDSHFVVLPETEAHEAPVGAGGGWMPPQLDIDRLEVHLPELPVFNPYSYYRQYVGVIISGRKLIYVNAQCNKPESVPINPEDDWRRHLRIVMDGGKCIWHALYDPATGRFSDFMFNGVA
jgi:hypothetical protein